MAKAEQPVLFFATPAALEAWIDEHGEESDGIWLKFAKKDSGIESVVYAEAVEIALSHGWIDGQAKRLRRPPLPPALHAAPSAQQVVEDQSREGREADRGGPHAPSGSPGGRDEPEEDGRWDDAYDSPSTATLPDDFQRGARRGARPRRSSSQSLGSTKRYSFLYRITDAKRPETRAKRIAEYVELLARGETLS